MGQSWRIAAMPLGRGGGVVGVGVPVGDNTPRVAYRGFISYSHRDAGIGRALHRKLEGYRLPKHVAGRESPRGIIPVRLTPIFRDREELSAGESLSDQVQAALAASDCLIVLCSPNAKASQWVSREIELFRQLHPDRPILAGLIAGEPADAFPAALTANGAEPIAADFRKGGDGQRLALLKLIAGMTGTPLDALVQRDAQRQTRRVTAITLASLTAVLVMAALLVMAIRAQREAERQRQQAEGLVEYMLTDLRQKLIGVGRLDVMTAVNERALGYYGAQGDLSKLPPESLERRARVIGAMGEDDSGRGKMDSARKKYVEFNRTTGALLAKAPNDRTRIFAHATSLNQLTLLDAQLGNVDKAIQGFGAVKALIQPLGRAPDAKPEWLKLYSLVSGNVCAGQVTKSDNLADGVEDCVTAVETSRKILARDKEDRSAQYDLVFHLTWLSKAMTGTGRMQEAESARIESVALVEDLVRREPDNMLFQEQQMEIYLGYARYLTSVGMKEKARRLIRQAEGVNRKLVSTDSTNKYWSNYAAKIAAAKKEVK